ncbi:MAG: divalent cation tolerance protein CutA [candidate division Zixibacteria bacterium]|nr:divalent cation tolerance protein CutA [candidate division Zixibacteria bacterium]
MDNSDFVLVFSSAGSQIEANHIAETLIEKKLAACVSILPGVTSHYCWKDKRESSYEVSIIIKSLRSKFEDLKKEIIELHSFEVPEILVVPVLDGSKDYLNWMKEVMA